MVRGPGGDFRAPPIRAVEIGPFTTLLDAWHVCRVLSEAGRHFRSIFPAFPLGSGSGLAGAWFQSRGSEPGFRAVFQTRTQCPGAASRSGASVQSVGICVPSARGPPAIASGFSRSVRMVGTAASKLRV